MPWFYRRLPMTLLEDFEVRSCNDENGEDVAIEKL